MTIKIEANNIICDTDEEQVYLPADVTIGVNLEQAREYFESHGDCVADWLSDKYGWLVESLDTRIYEEKEDKTFYIQEMYYLDRKNRIIDQVQNYEEYYDEKLTLKKLLEYGINNIHIRLKDGSYISGYDEDDFTKEQLNMELNFSEFDEDLDGYTIVRVEEN